MDKRRRSSRSDTSRKKRLAKRGQEIERKPYLESAQEGGPNLDPELPKDNPAGPGTFGGERSGQH